MRKRAGMCYDKGNFTKGKNRQMLGRTHFFIGTAAALAVLQPQTVPVLVTGAGAAAIGSLTVSYTHLTLPTSNHV